MTTTIKSIADVTVCVDENINDTFTITDLSDTSGGDTDADESALTYSITGGNSAGLFEIDSATRRDLTRIWKESLDYETAQQHILTITADEADGSGSDTATITINVNNIDDNDPSIADVTVAVDENINDTFTIMTSVVSGKYRRRWSFSPTPSPAVTPQVC